MNISLPTHFLRNITLSLTFLSALQPISGTPSFSAQVRDYASNITPGTWFGLGALALSAYNTYLWWNCKKLQTQKVLRKPKNRKPAPRSALDVSKEVSTELSRLMCSHGIDFLRTNKNFTDVSRAVSDQELRTTVLEEARLADLSPEARDARQRSLQEEIRVALLPHTDSLPTLQRKILDLEAQNQTLLQEYAILKRTSAKNTTQFKELLSRIDLLTNAHQEFIENHVKNNKTWRTTIQASLINELDTFGGTIDNLQDGLSENQEIGSTTVDKLSSLAKLLGEQYQILDNMAQLMGQSGSFGTKKKEIESLIKQISALKQSARPYFKSLATQTLPPTGLLFSPAKDYSLDSFSSNSSPSQQT